jgi:hypothetical protein
VSEHQLITPRRNFLIRALGFTAAGASISIPVLVADDPMKRFNTHLDGLRRALSELHPGVTLEASAINHANWAGMLYSGQLVATVKVAGQLEYAADRVRP